MNIHYACEHFLHFHKVHLYQAEAGLLLTGFGIGWSVSQGNTNGKS